MEKHSLANYAWAAISIIVVAAMIIMATPFGTTIRTRVVGIVGGLKASSDQAITAVAQDTSNPFKRPGQETQIKAGLYDENDVLLVTYEDSGLKADANYDYPEPSTVGSGVKASADYPTAVKLVLPGNLTTIGESVFMGSSFKEIIVSEGTQRISTNTFGACSRLATITLPESVTYIDGFFAGYSPVTTIIFQGTMAQWSNIDKGANWNYDIEHCPIQCTDGTITP